MPVTRTSAQGMSITAHHEHEDEFQNGNLEDIFQVQVGVVLMVIIIEAVLVVDVQRIAEDIKDV